MGNDLGREDAMCRFCDRIDIPLLMFFLTFVPLHYQAGKGRCLHSRMAAELCGLGCQNGISCYLVSYIRGLPGLLLDVYEEPTIT